MYLMIDNYDSFVYNLVSYFAEMNCPMIVRRNDEIDIAEIQKMIAEKQIKGIIISPGPKNPNDCGLSKVIVERFYKDIPILGVCLGHQVIATVFGQLVQKGRTPVHGKVDYINTNQTGLFGGLPKRFKVTRYHSLVVSDIAESSVLQVDATTDDNVIMGLSHKIYPIYAVQFHPEAVLTEYGHEMLENFVKLSESWGDDYAN